VKKNINHLGQTIGVELYDWQQPVFPADEIMAGKYCSLELLDPDQHAKNLYLANEIDLEGRMWTYLPYGPFDSFDEYKDWMIKAVAGRNPQYYAIIDASTNKAVGIASYMRITPAAGTIEIGHLCYSPLLQSTAAATEAVYLMMKKTFELGYRRCEWKCNALNEISCSAAQRLGFSFEGIFRNANIVKGRNRDTAWYSVIDEEWSVLNDVFQNWLAPTNFDDQNKQLTRLSALTKKHLKNIVENS
jgi:RimJ/RimL family protein N-acetyltransferase